MVTQQNKVPAPYRLLSKRSSALLVALFLFIVVSISFSCSSNRIDFAKLAPAETLVYLESSDLGAAINASIGSKGFRESVEELPDVSGLERLRIGVFVMGLDADEGSVQGQEATELRVRPRFVMVAESGSWLWNPTKFLDGPITEFVSSSYGKNLKTETLDEKDGGITAWKAEDGRRAFAATRGDLVFFSNDDDALRSVLATRRGERNNISGNSALQRIRGESILASGYISQAGVEQLSNFVGISTALSTTDDDDGRSFIARIVPDLVRANVKEVLWTAEESEDGIDDRYEIVLTEKVAEEMSVATQTVIRKSDDILRMIPSSVYSVTRYELASPSIAWNSLVKNLTDSTDVLNGTVLGRAADSVFAPYGVVSAKGLVAQISAPIFTVSLDESGEQVVAVFKSRTPDAVREIVAIDFKKPSESLEGFSVWSSDDDDFAFAQKSDLIVVGEAESVKRVASSSRVAGNISKSAGFAKFDDAKGASVTMGDESEAFDQLARALSLKSTKKNGAWGHYIVSTEFTTRGIVRKTSSSIGLIGSLISQFSFR